MRQRRLNKQEQHYLELEFLKDPNWRRGKIKSLSQHLGVAHVKVYKWHYDKVKKAEVQGGKLTLPSCNLDVVMFNDKNK